jgi:hypothetical protein
MLILIANVLYAAVMLAFMLISFFIVFHVLRYSYSKTGTILTLAIFLPVVVVLMYTNYFLFQHLPINDFFSSF